MRAVLSSAAIAAFLATSSIAFAASPHDIGAIKSLDLKANAITLADGKTYTLPKGFKDTSLKVGEKVDVSYVKSGNKLEATAVTMVK